MKRFLMATSCQARSESNRAAASLRFPCNSWHPSPERDFKPSTLACVLLTKRIRKHPSLLFPSVSLVHRCLCAGVFGGPRGLRCSPGGGRCTPGVALRRGSAAPVPRLQPALPGLEAAEVPPASLSDALAGSADSPGALEIPCHQHLLVRKSPGTRSA